MDGGTLGPGFLGPVKGSAMSPLVLLRHRSVLFLLVIAVAWGGWELFLTLTAPGRIDPALEPALRARAPVAVAIRLGFAPENFHIRLLQSYGVVSGVQGTTVWVNRVSPDDLRRIARYYWVQQITMPSERAS
jgi:hypothetical protein